jgi:DNA-binding transcriptional ArsR family regulator
MDELSPVFEVVARYFRMLSDPTRLKILHSICADERTVSEIVEQTGCTQSNVSRNLALMHQMGGVARRRSANFVHYRVADPMLAEVCRMVCVRIASQLEEQTPLREQLQDFQFVDSPPRPEPLYRPDGGPGAGPAAGASSVG